MFLRDYGRLRHEENGFRVFRLGVPSEAGIPQFRDSPERVP
jgi:hypothetical protein